MSADTQFANEVRVGERFAFGKNWSTFLARLDEGQVQLATQSLRDALGVEDLSGRRFLDVGCGSGLFGLAARRLGAQVHSFDFDLESVECARELKARDGCEDGVWRVEQGSILDTAYLKGLGTWDIVYSWGVLHHTGNMMQALANAADLVRDGGMLYIAIYNDQGWPSRAWLETKKLYNRLPSALRWLVLWPAAIRLWGPTLARDLLAGRPLRSWRRYRESSLRGMSPWTDVVDWVGGLPFEVSTPEKIFRFFRDRGFVLTELRTCGCGHGCNEFVFRKR